MVSCKIVYKSSGKHVYFLDGREVTRKEYNMAVPSRLDDLFEAGTTATSQTRACWPMMSDALSVHPDQVGEATARNRKHGVNVGYLPDGTAVIPDRGARKAILKLEGFHDNNGGYGD